MSNDFTINSEIAIDEEMEILFSNNQGVEVLRQIVAAVERVVKLVPNVTLDSGETLSLTAATKLVTFIKTSATSLCRIDISATGRVKIYLSGKVVLPFLNKNHRFCMQLGLDGVKSLEVVAEPYTMSITSQLQIFLLYLSTLVHQMILMRFVNEQKFIQVLSEQNILDRCQTIAFESKLPDETFATAQIKIKIASLADVKTSVKRKAPDDAKTEQASKVALTEPTSTTGTAQL